MKWFFQLVSLVFHPVVMPTLGIVFFFRLTPVFYPQEIVLASVSSVGILTIIIPLLIAVTLKKIGYIDSYQLSETRQRILPLCINLLIIGTIIYKLMPKLDAPELYYFFTGILGSTLSCLIMAIFNVKASIHMIALTGLTTFLFGLGFHYSINVTLLISILICCTGLTASSRLYLGAHNNVELILGIFTGLIPQIITFKYWL